MESLFLIARMILLMTQRDMKHGKRDGGTLSSVMSATKMNTRRDYIMAKKSRIDVARKHILGQLKGREGPLNNMAYIPFRGDPIYHSGICFSRIGSEFGWDVDRTKIREFLDYNPKRSTEYVEYVDYVLNRSPLACVFKDKDPERIPHEPTRFNTKNSTRAIVVGAVMLRYLQEHRDVIEWWEKLREVGFSENMAFLIPHLFRKSDKKMNQQPEGFYHSFSSTFSPDRVKNWLDGKMPNNPEDQWMYYGTYWKYRDMSSLFGKGFSDLIYPVDLMRVKKSNGNWGGEVHYYAEEDIKKIMIELCKINGINYEGHIT